MAPGARVAVLAAVLCAALLAATPAFAVKSGRYKGTDITFRVKKNRISKVQVVATYSCQRVGTGNLPDGEVRKIYPPGKYKVSKKGRFGADRYLGSYGDVYDLFFNWHGRIKGKKVKVTVQTGYKYGSYTSADGYRQVVCYSTTRFSAKRVGG